MKGGLGNILFPMAYSYSISINQNKDLVLCYDHSGIVHTEPQEYKSSFLKNIPEIKNNYYYYIIEEKSFSFSHNLLPLNRNIFLDGYFQSEKYFKENKDSIVNLIKSDQENYKKAQETYAKIFQPGDKVVSMHVRRGNYLKLKKYHKVLSKDYYKKALSKINHNKVLIFSDDIHHCKSVFKEQNQNCQYVLVFLVWRFSLCFVVRMDCQVKK